MIPIARDNIRICGLSFRLQYWYSSPEIDTVRSIHGLDWVGLGWVTNFSHVSLVGWVCEMTACLCGTYCLCSIYV